MTQIPTLETERMILRPPKAEDFDTYSKTLMSDRAQYIGGPYSLSGAWRDFSCDVASWLLRGFGPWAMEESATGFFLGMVTLHKPASYPENEMGWVILEVAEGKGFAYEAAMKAREYAYEVLGWSTVVSYIDPKNSRSIALAERMGATRDDNAALPDGASGPEDCLVFRHPASETL